MIVFEIGCPFNSKIAHLGVQSGFVRAIWDQGNLKTSFRFKWAGALLPVIIIDLLERMNTSILVSGDRTIHIYV